MDDRIIVRCILEDGKKELFSLVVKSYRGKVFSCAYGITQNTELAKEVAQQTFIRAFTHLSSWNGKELGAWLTAIAAHEALNLLKKEKRKINISEMFSPLTTARTIARSSSSVRRCSTMPTSDMAIRFVVRCIPT